MLKVPSFHQFVEVQTVECGVILSICLPPDTCIHFQRLIGMPCALNGFKHSTQLLVYQPSTIGGCCPPYIIVRIHMYMCVHVFETMC